MIAAALTCMAMTVFHEARGETVLGQYAVAQVIWNRAEGKQKNVCEVVHAPRQFSCYNSRLPSPAKIDPDAYEKARIISRVVMNHRMPKDFSEGANFYHAEYVKPKWSYTMHKTTVVGRHIFYKGISHS